MKTAITLLAITTLLSHPALTQIDIQDGKPISATPQINIATKKVIPINI